MSRTALSSPDVASLAGSVASEDRLDSDLEADLQQVGLLDSANNIDVEHFSVTSSEALSISNAAAEYRSRFTLDGVNVSPSTFIRKAILSGVSNQLKSASSKVDIGIPSCLSFKKYLVVGTSKGVIFGFNLQQVLRFCLGTLDSKAGSDYQATKGQGAVTTLNQNLDGTILLSGYQSGRIAVWRLSASTSSSDAHKLQGKIVSHELSSTDHGDNDSIFSGTNLKTELGGSDFGPARNSNLSTAPTTAAVLPSVSRRLSETKILRFVGKSPSADAIVGQLLYVIDDAHGVGQAIALVSFTTLSSLAVAVDTGGSVFALNLKRGITGSRKDSFCFFSGSRGEICALNALGSTTVLSDDLPARDESPASDHGHESSVRSNKYLPSYALVAMASFTKLIVAQLRPHLQVAHWQPLKGPAGCLPLLSWMWSPRSESTGMNTALLAFGRGSTLNVLRVTTIVGPTYSTTLSTGLDLGKIGSPGSDERKSLSGILHFHTLYSFELGYELISMNWISSSQLVALDVMESVHLVDKSTGEDAETADLSGVQLCYSSYLFQSVANGGSVSEALSYAGRRSCSQSIDVHGSQMLILGATGVHLVALRTCSEIICGLFSNGLFDAALIYCDRVLDWTYRKQFPNAAGFLPPPVNSATRIKVPSVPNTTSPWPTLQSDIQGFLRDLFCPLLDHQSVAVPYDNQTDLAESLHRPVGLLAITLAVRIACFLDRGCDFLVTELYGPLSRDPKTRTWLCLALYEILLCQLPPFSQLNSDQLTLPISRNTDNNVTLNLAVTLAYSLPPDVIMNWITWCLTSEYDVDRAAWSRECGLTGNPPTGRLWAEHVLLCLPPQCIDLNDAVQLCWKHQLFRAYLHIYTDILFDFETPFRRLIDRLSLHGQEAQLERSNSSVLPASADFVLYGQALLLLLRNALAGESYSQQPLPSPLNVDVPGHIFNLLLNEIIEDKSFRQDHQPQPKYPRLWLVLTHCPTDFLNLLMLSIEGDQFFAGGDLGLSHRTHLYYKLVACALEERLVSVTGEPAPNITETSTAKPVGTIVSSSGTDSSSSRHAGNFAIPVFNFLVHQLLQTGTGAIRFEDGKLFQLFQHICQQLEEFESPIVTDTFEASVIDLIETERITQLEHCLRLADSAKLYRVSEHVNRRLGRRVDALRAQLARLDQAVLSQRVPESVIVQLMDMIFAFLEQLFPESSGHPADHESALSPDEMEQTQFIAMEKLQLLTSLDTERTLRLLYRFYPLPMPKLLSKVFPNLLSLSPKSNQCTKVAKGSFKVCRQLLTAYYRARQLYWDSHKIQSKASTEQSDSVKPILYENQNSFGWDQFLTGSHPEVAECYIRLLMQSNQTETSLLWFLNTNTEYRLDVILQTLSPTEFPRECAFLYEKQGQFDLASNIYEQMFLTCWHRLLAMVPVEPSDPDNLLIRFSNGHLSDQNALESARSAARNAADLWFALTQRRSVLEFGDNTETHSDVSKQNIWFHIIDVLLHEEQQSKTRALESEINDLFHSLLTYLPQAVSLTSIVSYILQSATWETTSRFDPKTSRLLTRLVATCHTEVEQMNLNYELARRELTQKQLVLLDQFKRGFTAAVGEFSCSLCQGSLRSMSRMKSAESSDRRSLSHSKPSEVKEETIVAFRCQHIFHTYCLEKIDAIETDPDGSISLFGFRRRWICPICQTCPLRRHSANLASSRSDPVREGEAITNENFQSCYEPIRVNAPQISSDGNPFA